MTNGNDGAARRVSAGDGWNDRHRRRRLWPRCAMRVSSWRELCRQRDRARAFGAENGIRVYRWSVDDYDARQQGVGQIVADLGEVDVLVNNAGITRDSSFMKMTPQMWRELMR